jgi:general secretion pathway protein E
VWHSAGCPKCTGTGYFERTGIFEVLPVDERIYDMIIAGRDEHALRAHLREEGFRLLLRDGLNKAAEGITDLSELTRIGAQSYLDQARRAGAESTPAFLNARS